MDGIPADARDKANRVAFTQQYEDLERQRDSLSGKLTGMDQIDVVAGGRP